MNEIVKRWARAPETYDPALRFDQDTGQPIIPPWISPFITTAAHLNEYHEREGTNDRDADHMP